MKVIGVIPARFQSTRFPGKPLADILGKPMIWWTYHQVKKVDLDDVIVATDDRRILEECEKFGMNCIMTSSNHQCGTERVAEVAFRISADYFLNVQGDEPIVEPENLKKLVDFQLSHEEYDACTLRKCIENPMDAVNTTVSKVVCNSKSEIVYISRQAIPFPKASIDYNYYCAMGIYIFSNNALDIYRNEGKEDFESAEDIELLRLVNHGTKIYSLVVDSESVSVDTYKDLLRIESILTERGIKASGGGYLRLGYYLVSALITYVVHLSILMGGVRHEI